MGTTLPQFYTPEVGKRIGDPAKCDYYELVTPFSHGGGSLVQDDVCLFANNPEEVEKLGLWYAFYNTLANQKNKDYTDWNLSQFREIMPQKLQDLMEDWDDLEHMDAEEIQRANGSTADYMEGVIDIDSIWVDRFVSVVQPKVFYYDTQGIKFEVNMKGAELSD